MSVLYYKSHSSKRIIITLFIFLLLVYFVFKIIYVPVIQKNKSFSFKINSSIIETINSMLNIHYGKFDEVILSELLSEALLEEVKTSPRFIGFRERRLPFRVSSEYLETLNYTGTDEDGNKFFHVRVMVYEGWFLLDHMIHELVLKVRQDYSSIIVFIDYDR